MIVPGTQNRPASHKLNMNYPFALKVFTILKNAYFLFSILTLRT